MAERLGGSPTFPLGHAKTPLNRAGATWRRHHPNPAEAPRRWRGNGIAGLAAGSSRHRQKNRGNSQASCRDPDTRPELRLPPSQLEREWSLRPGLGWITGNLCDLSKGYFAPTFLSSSLTARQVGSL